MSLYIFFYIVFYGVEFGCLMSMSIYLLTSKRNAFGHSRLREGENIRRIMGVLLGCTALTFTYSLVSVYNSVSSPTYDLYLRSVFYDFALVSVPALYLFTVLIPPRRSVWRIVWRTMTPSVVFYVAYLVTDRALWVQFNGLWWIIVWVFSLIRFFRKLHRYERMLQDNYSEIADRGVRWVAWLLVAFVAEILCYSVTYIFESEWINVMVFVQGVLNIVVGIYLTIQADNHILPNIPMDYSSPEPVLNKATEMTLEMEGTSPSSEEQSTGEYAWIGERLVRCCEKNGIYLQPDLTLESLAHQIDTNRTYLGRYFSHIGSSYYNYINSLRIDHALKMMQDNPEINLLEVAESSGYTTSVSFRRAFSAKVGCLPSEYKTRLLEERQ